MQVLITSTSGLGATADEGSGVVPSAASAGEALLHVPVGHPVDADDFVQDMQVYFHFTACLRQPTLLHACYYISKVCGKLFTKIGKSAGDEEKSVRSQVEWPPAAGEC